MSFHIILSTDDLNVFCIVAERYAYKIHRHEGRDDGNMRLER